MDKVIYKYPLELAIAQKVKLTQGYQILDIQLQSDELVMWAIIDRHADEEVVHIDIIGTGDRLSNKVNRQHISTVQVGAFVWHIFLRLLHTSQTWIDAKESGEYDTVYKCPNCGKKYSVQAEDIRTTLDCECGFSGKLF